MAALHFEISQKLVKYSWVKAGLLDDEIPGQIQEELNLPIDREDEIFDEVCFVFLLKKF